MELKVTLIVALVAAITISVHAQRARGGRGYGRKRGQGRFGGSPGSDRPQMTGGPRQGGPPMGGRRFDGPGQGDQQRMADLTVTTTTIITMTVITRQTTTITIITPKATATIIITRQKRVTRTDQR
uniref:185/333 n=1 Tax=Heliocidaris erythrogramma TaxID=7634 RepID=I3W883_HELER|nr:185/333 [Heliocidaris erythrogramma]